MKVSRPISCLCAFLALVVVFACLPNPQSVEERRRDFERECLKHGRGFPASLLESIGILGRSKPVLLDAAPSAMMPVGAVFGGTAKLAGYEIEPARPTPGSHVDITLYWTATGPIPEDYQVFVHGDGIGGQASRIHGDHFPANGKYPTDVWLPGEIVADAFRIWVPPGYGAPKLGIYVGLYKDDYRVPLTDKGNAPSEGEDRSRAITIEF